MASDEDQDALHAGQVSLHLQFARPVAHLGGNAEGQQRRRLDDERLDGAVEARSGASHCRSFHLTGGQRLVRCRYVAYNWRRFGRRESCVVAGGALLCRLFEATIPASFAISFHCFFGCREAPEPTGDEPDDADLDAPKIYELVMIRGVLAALIVIFMMP